MQLDRPGDGIHGAPNAATIGRAGSHGCIRLANWDAALIRTLVTVGTPVSKRLAFGVWRLAFGVWRSAFGVRRSAFGVRARARARARARTLLLAENECQPN
jgi:hypothetical protein